MKQDEDADTNPEMMLSVNNKNILVFWCLDQDKINTDGIARV